MSEVGLKRIVGLDYTSKFEGINWTIDPNIELPIKMKESGYGSETPATLG